MEDVKLYSKSKSLQMAVTKDILQNSPFVSNWKNHTNHRLLDIGCGDGEALVRLFLPMVPGYSSVVAIDILEEMIAACRANFGSVPNVSFEVFDIATKYANHIENLGKFSHVTSNFCLHWIPDQEQVFRNIFKVMLPGGHLFSSFLRDTELSKAVKALASSEKWAPFMMNWKSYPSVYTGNEEWEPLLRTYLESAGFDQIQIETSLQKFDFRTDRNLKDFLRSVNPFIKNIPDDLKDEYLDHFMAACLEDMSQLSVSFEMINLSAVKPTGLI